MAQLITCTQCKTSLSVPEQMLGKLVRCPNCSITFTAPQTLLQAPSETRPIRPEPPPREARGSRYGRDDYDRRDDDRDYERRDYDRYDRRDYARRDRDDDDDDDYDRRRDDSRNGRIHPAWLTVKSGLNSQFIGSLIVLIAVLICFLFGVLVAASQAGRGGRGNGVEVLFGMLICVGILVSLGGAITNLVGKFMCLATPEPRARGYLVGHLFCLAGNAFILLIMFVMLVEFSNGRRGGPLSGPQVALALLGAFNALVFLTGAILESLYFKETALAFENRSLAGGCLAYLIFQIFWLLGVTGLALLFMGLDPNNGNGRSAAWGLGLFIVGGGGAIVYFIWNLVLVRGAYTTIREAHQISQRRYYYED